MNGWGFGPRSPNVHHRMGPTGYFEARSATDPYPSKRTSRNVPGTSGVGWQRYWTSADSSGEKGHDQRKDAI